MNCKAIILGCAAVGRDALAMKFASGYFKDEAEPVIEVNYKRSIVVDNKDVQLDILVTAGTDDPHMFRESMLRSKDVFILVYSIGDKDSFDVLKKFHDYIAMSLDKCTFPCIVCGNKCDLETERKVSTEEGKAFANSINASFFETSAKTDQNVEAVFQTAVRKTWEFQQESMNDKKKMDKSCLLI